MPHRNDSGMPVFTADDASQVLPEMIVMASRPLHLVAEQKHCRDDSDIAIQSSP